MHIQSNVEREQERTDQIHLFQLMCLDLLLMFRDALSRRSKKQKKNNPEGKRQNTFRVLGFSRTSQKKIMLSNRGWWYDYNSR